MLATDRAHLAIDVVAMSLVWVLLWSIAADRAMEALRGWRRATTLSLCVAIYLVVPLTIGLVGVYQAATALP